MHEHPIGNGTNSREGIAHLNHALEQSLEQNRALLEEIARFAKHESLRMAHRQLDHADTAMTHFYARHDFSSLIGAQQEWAKQAMQEYAALGLRYAEMFQSLTQRVQSHVESAAGDLRRQAEDEMEEFGHGRKDAAALHPGLNGEQTHLQA